MPGVERDTNEGKSAWQRPLEAGLVTRNPMEMLDFYQRVLGFEQEGEIPFPGTGVVHRLRRGVSTLRLLALEQPPEQSPVKGEFTATIGIRYLALWVVELEVVVTSCRRWGLSVPVVPRELRPGIQVAMVMDPDGNTLELMAEASE